MSCTRTALVDTIVSLQSSGGGLIAALGMHEIHAKIHDILDNAVSSWFGNVVHIVAYLFNCASRQPCDVS